MILESVILNVIDRQLNYITLRDEGLKREFIPSMQSLSSHALIISGVRRCGKSTLLMQVMRQMNNVPVIYLNFESPQLYDFSSTDFIKQDEFEINVVPAYNYLLR